MTKDTSKTLVEKILNIKPTETFAIVGGFLMFFLLFTSYAILRPVRETMGIAGGVRNLQWLFTATFFATILLQLLFGSLTTRIPRRAILPWTYAFFVTNLIAFYIALLFQQDNAWIARIFYVWLSVFNLLSISVAWSVLNDIMEEGQSKRLFALIASGSSAGSMLGPLITAVLVQQIDHSGLMFISAMLLAGSGFTGIMLHRWRDRNPLPYIEKEADTREKPLEGNFMSGAAATFKSPYLLGIATFVILLAAATTFLYFDLMQVIARTFPDKHTQTQIFSMIDFIVNTCTIGLQVFITGRIAERMGVGVLLVAVPVIMVIGFIIMAFAPVFIVIAFIMIVRRVGQYAFVRPGREMLYSQVTPEEKYQAKSFTDTVIYRGGDVISAWLKKIFDMIGDNTTFAMLAGAVIAGLWAWNGVGLAKAYKKKESENASLYIQDN